MSKPILYALLMLSITAFCGRVDAAPLDKWLERANTAYMQEKYDTAVAYYKKILESGAQNAAVYYNLANTYFRLNKTGLALLNYEKALRLRPDDADIRANIRFVNKHIVDRIPSPEYGFFESILRRFHMLLSLRAQLWFGWVLLMILCILFSLGLFVSGNIRLWLVYIGGLCLVVFIAVAVSAAVKIHQSETVREAIVLEKTIDARNQPEGEKILFTAHEGTKFTIRKNRGEWVLASLPSGVSGWIERSALGEI